MPENKKHKNSPVPGECLKEEGTGQDIQYTINMLSAQNMLEKLEGEWEEYKLEATNQKERSVNSMDLINGLVSTIKAYDNTPEQQKEQKEHNIR